MNSQSKPRLKTKEFVSFEYWEIFGSGNLSVPIIVCCLGLFHGHMTAQGSFQ